MTRKKTLIIMLSVFLTILLCSIAFGIAIACVKPQKPLIELEISLKDAIVNGTAENYDYFTKKELGKFDKVEGDEIRNSVYYNKIIIITDNSMTDGFKADLWYCNYYVKDETLGMSKINEITFGELEYKNNLIYYPSIKTKKETIYQLITHSHNANTPTKEIYIDYYYTLTANAETLAKISDLHYFT